MANNTNITIKEIQDEAERELARADEMLEAVKDNVRGYISGKRTLIKILMTTKETGWVEEITEIYESLVRRAVKYLVEPDVLYDYAEFLLEQNRFDRGIEVCERLLKFYALEKTTPQEKLDKASNLLDRLYRSKRD